MFDFINNQTNAGQKEKTPIYLSPRGRPAYISESKASDVIVAVLISVHVCNCFKRQFVYQENMSWFIILMIINK